jgi:regulatory protein
MAGFDAPEIQEELERLEAVGLVDDESFARAVAEHQVKVRRAGRRAVAAALAAKGVPRATIDETLASLPRDEEGRAESLASERARSLSALPPEKAYPRLVGFLQRRGYDGTVARSAARSALLRPSDEA